MHAHRAPAGDICARSGRFRRRTAAKAPPDRGKSVEKSAPACQIERHTLLLQQQLSQALAGLATGTIIISLRSSARRSAGWSNL